MNDLNTVLRRTVLSLTLLPALIAFTALALVMLFPLLIFVGWTCGDREPLRSAWQMVVTEGPITMFGEAWRGMDEHA